jgi:hypothetical protein
MKMKNITFERQMLIMVLIPLHPLLLFFFMGNSVDAMFYFLAFGTTMEFVNTYFCCLVPLFKSCTKKRDRNTTSSYNRSRFTTASLPRFKSTFSQGGEPEGEWQELGSVIESPERTQYQPGHV